MGGGGSRGEIKKSATGFPIALFDEIYIETIRAEICYTYIYQQNVCRVRRYKNE